MHQRFQLAIDAISTQTAIAEKIIDNGADYILSVKGNQPELLKQVESRFNKQKPADMDEVTEVRYYDQQRNGRCQNIQRQYPQALGHRKQAALDVGCNFR